MTSKAAIILAGGKGERFQSDKEPWQDKVLAPLLGKPLLIHTVENAFKVADEIAICVNEEKRKERYVKILEEYGIENVNLLVDRKFDHLGGPLVAILTGMTSVESELCITLPGDMPFVQPGIVDYMFNQAKNARVVVPMWPNGRLETLLMVLERSDCVGIAETLCELRRPRSDDLIRGALNVIFVSVLGILNKIDPDLKSFVNINSPEDLSKLQPRTAIGTIDENIHIDFGPLPSYDLKKLREAAKLLHCKKFSEASKIFSGCTSRLENQNSLFWKAVSQENEGKSRLKWSSQLPQQKLSLEERMRASEAFTRAANTYELEAKANEKARCFFLADRARSDKNWCEARKKEII